jgi:hypothetical protein
MEPCAGFWGLMQRRPLRQSGLRILSDDLGSEAMSIPAGVFLPRCVLPRSLRRGLIILSAPAAARGRLTKEQTGHWNAANN